MLIARFAKVRDRPPSFRITDFRTFTGIKKVVDIMHFFIQVTTCFLENTQLPFTTENLGIAAAMNYRN